MNAVNLILSDARGVYIPRDFVTDKFGEIQPEHCARWNISAEDAAILAAGPDHDFYWETWEDALNNAEFTADNGDVYRLHHDGDLWAVRIAHMTLEEKQNFGFDLEAPDGWTLFTIGAHFLCPLYYGDDSGLSEGEIAALESWAAVNGCEIGGNVPAGFDECEITGMRGACVHVWIKNKVAE